MHLWQHAVWHWRSSQLARQAVPSQLVRHAGRRSLGRSRPRCQLCSCRGAEAARMCSAQGFIREFFYQNPLSHLGLIVLRNGVAERLTDLSGSPARPFADPFPALTSRASPALTRHQCRQCLERATSSDVQQYCMSACTFAPLLQRRHVLGPLHHTRMPRDRRPAARRRTSPSCALRWTAAATRR